MMPDKPHSAFVVHAAGRTKTVFNMDKENDTNELERLRQRNYQLEKELAAIRQRVVNDLQTLLQPLTPMKGFVRTLLDDEAEEWYSREDRREFYEIIEENIDCLKRLVTNLMHYYPLHPERAARNLMNWQVDVDVHQIIESIVIQEQEHTDKHKLVLDLNPRPIFVELDPDKFAKVLKRFIRNAIKYSLNGGEI